MLKNSKLQKFILTLALSFCLVVVPGLCFAVVSGTKVAQTTALQVIASGLESPRGIDFGPDGAIYVAEAGTGGSTFIPSFAEGLALGFGSNGALTRIKNGKQERVLTGLPSLTAVPEGTPVPTEQGSYSQVVGLDDIKFGHYGDVYAVFGYGTNPVYRDTLGSAGEDLGKLIKFRLKADGSLERHGVVADLLEYERINNPDGGDLYGDPYSLRVQGNNLIVADAGANDVVRADKAGEVSVVSVFPRRTVDGATFQAVPTVIAIGPDHAYYVGQLTGNPSPEGAARIYRIVPGQEPEVYADGFTQIIGLDFDSKGNLYVLEYSTQSQGANNTNPEGALIQLSPKGARKTLVDAGEGLIAPTGLRVGPDDAIYVSNYGAILGRGQVVRIEPTKSFTRRESRVNKFEPKEVSNNILNKNLKT